jgi:hypothetical protein
VRVIVHWHRQTREHIERWTRLQPGRDPGRRDLANLLLDEMARRLQAADGMPPGVLPVSGYSPPRYWWKGLPRLWIMFSVVDEPWTLRALFRDRLRTVTIWRLQRERRSESEP